MMTLEILLSAMDLADVSYIDSLNVTTDAVVINQCDREAYKRLTRRSVRKSDQTVIYVETKERGLSKSRNRAMDEADSDICIFCDNDVEYVEGYDELIKGAFKAHEDADIIVFYIKRKEKPEPNYPHEKRMGYLSVLKIFSPEIAYRREAMDDIRFDERFGAGSGRYLMGEENIFLHKALKKKKKIYYVPVKIAELREEESSWFKGYNEAFFISRGAGYAVMSGLMSPLLILQFAIRKRSLYRESMSTKRALTLMFRGRREIIGGSAK